MGKKIYHVHLTSEDKEKLSQLINSGVSSARKLRRARTLLLASEGFRDEDIALSLKTNTRTVQRTRQRFVEEGLESSLNERCRSGQPPKLTGKTEAALIALSCSDPPDGRSQWTMQLLADHLVELGYIERISDEAVRLCLKKNKSNPG